jgi:MoxR-like ATPase
MTQTLRNLKVAVDPRSARETMERLAQNLGRALLGKESQTRLAVTCLVGHGHLLLEDVPGVGKTTLAEAIALSCDLSFARIQFTADLLPADILGTQVFYQQSGSFEFRPGPLFHQLVLADELNRAPPRTQSALLEAMAHAQVSMDGATHKLPRPFTVIATQNPTDLSGTYPLPDSQLDRFLMRLSLGHPAPEVEAEIVRSRGSVDPVHSLPSVASGEEIAALQELAAGLRVEASIADYAVRLSSSTRQHPDIERGASTRAVLALVAAAKAHALWDKRDFVTPTDVREVLVPTLAHRILLRSAMQGAYSRDEAAYLLEEMGRKVPVPR